MEKTPHDPRREKHRYSLPRFYRYDSKDAFEKCRRFEENFLLVDAEGVLTDCHRVELESGLDRKTSYFDLKNGRSQAVLCFDSNGYLGLQHHPVVKKAAIDAIEKFGLGTPSVPLLGGSNRMVREAEEKIARFHGREDAMLFSSAFSANISLIGAIARKCDTVLYDESVHASTLQGIQLSKPRDALSFRNNDVRDLEEKLKAANSDNVLGDILVLTEGVYSMEGSILNLPRVRSLCNQYGAKLIVDECHSIGVLGKKGRGIEDHFQMPGASDLIVGCFSKALGLLGGYVVGSRSVIHYLRYLSSSYIFSTTLPAPLCAGLVQCLDLIDQEPQHLTRLQENIETMKVGFEKVLGLPAPGMGSAIFKVPVHDNKLLFALGSELLRNGLKCGVVTYPAVKDQRGLLRIVVTARHTAEDIERALSILKKVLKKNG